MKLFVASFLAIASPAFGMQMCGSAYSNGNYYKVMENVAGFSWSEAKDAAEAMTFCGVTGHLVTITDAAENDLVTTTVQQCGDFRKSWIGLSDQVVEGTFEWVTGEAFSYNDWCSGEPNNVGSGGEDFTEILIADGCWNDRKVNGENIDKFTVEFDNVPSDCEELRCVTRDSHTYCFERSGSISWQQAKDAAEGSQYTCPSTGAVVSGRLATFETAAEEAWAMDSNGDLRAKLNEVDAANTAVRRAWIGARMPASQDPWAWIFPDGSIQSLTDQESNVYWAGGNPNGGLNEDCVNFFDLLVTGAFGYNDENCGNGQTNLYIVEYDCNPNGGVGGDPHFKTWSGHNFDFHGVCDLLFMNVPSYGNGLGTELHVRTKRRQQYSYIESAVLRIGSDIFEVGSFGDYFLNGVEGAELPAQMGHFGTVTHEQVNKKKHRFEIQLDQDSKIVISTFKDMVYITADRKTLPTYKDCVGMIGSTSGVMVARDGLTNMEMDPIGFGKEWQVRDTESKLFQDVNRHPQYPEACIMPDVKSVEAGRRGLGEANGIDEEAARIECAKFHHADMDACIFDIIATGDLEFAQAGSF